MKLTKKEKRVWKNRMLGTVATVGLMGTMITSTGMVLATEINGNDGSALEQGRTLTKRQLLSSYRTF
ncbi:hypothetical protein [Enterococcus hirae]|uniref:hypothetical protein n=1 Tax=Enterococcus hirae TaxID=1354 RepID=UPI001A972877|nr:hypothetical protein [Enterococcus hirae]MBO1103296.1 hypothetical protein [Enterococcus hirae]